jgi:hypothetical protein
MSWDIFVMNLPEGVSALSDIPKDYRGPPLGPRSPIIAKISSLYPGVDFSDPSWGVLVLPECIIEFSLQGSNEEVTALVMHIRGGDRAPDIVAHILGELGMRAVDPSSRSGLFEQDPILRSESFARWRSFRSHVATILNGRS